MTGLVHSCIISISWGAFHPLLPLYVQIGYTTLMPSLFICQVPILPLGGCVTHIYQYPRQRLNQQPLHYKFQLYQLSYQEASSMVLARQYRIMQYLKGVCYGAILNEIWATKSTPCTSLIRCGCSICLGYSRYNPIQARYGPLTSIPPHM